MATSRKWHHLNIWVSVPILYPGDRKSPLYYCFTFFLIYFFTINTKSDELLITLIVLQSHWWRIKNKHQPVCSSVCFILQGSGSLMFSLSFNKLCLCRFHFFPDALMLVFSSSLVDWWEYSSIYCWTAVGGASVMVWLLWEELHWRCDCCGRSFTEGVIVVGGASLKVWLLWEELHWRRSRSAKIKDKSVTEFVSALIHTF